MKKVALVLIVLFTIMMVASCATYTIPVSATSNEMGTKVGEAKGTTILGVFGGDTESGIQKAAANGGISKISSVDFSYNPGIFGIFQTYTCTVTGE